MFLTLILSCIYCTPIAPYIAAYVPREECFFDGMDAYSKTWLQFVFPVYIWVLVGLIILISHFSQRFARLLGNNPVSILATLILLSYAKILHTFITAVYITYLEYPANYSRKMWLHDANIDILLGNTFLSS